MELGCWEIRSKKESCDICNWQFFFLLAHVLRAASQAEIC